MNNCVDSQTALELKEAGFVQPEPKAGQMWYIPLFGAVQGKEMPVIVNYVNAQEEKVYFSAVGVFVENRDHIGMSLGVKAFSHHAIFAPTNSQIIAEMPPGTGLGRAADGNWVCRFDITEMQEDFRHDPCPHKAAAKAWAAWKSQTN